MDDYMFRIEHDSVLAMDIPYDDIPTLKQLQQLREEACKKGCELYKENKFTEALPLIQKAANAGYPEAMYDLSLMWFNSAGVPQKSDKYSYTWMKKAAYEGYVPAYQPLAYKYLNGIGVIKNIGEAVFWLKKALNDNPDLILNIPYGVMLHENNLRLDQDKFDAGMKAFRNQQYDVAYRCFLNQALAGNSIAYFVLSNMLENGQGTEKDPVESFRWMLEAATSENIAAYPIIAWKYLLGNGTAVNFQKAEEWAEKIKNSNQNELEDKELERVLIAYNNEDYLDPDLFKCFPIIHNKHYHEAEPLSFYYHSALAWNPDAMYNLSICYSFGHGVTVDKEKSFYWMKRAAVGYCYFYDAYEQLAYKYYKGIGTPKEPRLATLWAQRALDNAVTTEEKIRARRILRESNITFARLTEYEKSPSGKLDLLPGMDAKLIQSIFEEGERLYQQGQFALALPYLEKAGKAGHGDALYYISEYYFRGILVKENPNMGQAFLVEAYSHNSYLARLKIYEYSGSYYSSTRVIEYLRAETGTDYNLAEINFEKIGPNLQKAIQIHDSIKHNIRQNDYAGTLNTWDECYRLAYIEARRGNPDALCFCVFELDPDPYHNSHYKLAALMGHSYAWRKLGEIYSGAVSDRCYVEAAKRGNEKAKTVCDIRNLNYHM